MNQKRPLVIYIQYTDPAYYPPLQHSSRILAARGFKALFLGTGAADRADPLSFPSHDSITIWRLRFVRNGMMQQLSFLTFTLWCAAICIWHRPKWIYASDHLSCPATLVSAMLSNARIIYHEHDTPMYSVHPSWAQRAIMAARRKLANAADICVLPQTERLVSFVSELGRKGPVQCVWNCPELEEVRAGALRHAPRTSAFTFYFHGSLNRERLPLTVIEALARISSSARLIIVGYETLGSRNYAAELIERAATLGLGDRVHYAGPLPRGEMLTLASTADVGLAFMPTDSNDVNMVKMTGASNKPFDYLAVGQMLLVSNLPDWRAMFVDPGYALSCDPYSVEDLTRTMSWCVDNPEQVRRMGREGRERILTEWNYECCFEPVAEQMTG